MEKIEKQSVNTDQAPEKKAPQTSAERQRAYRARKRAEKQKKLSYYVPDGFLAEEGEGAGIIDRDELQSRHQTYLAIFYPDSAPEDWVEYLSNTGCNIWVAEHDEDVWSAADQRRNPDHVAGSLKKRHYHLVWQYDTKQSVVQFAKDVRYLNGAGHVKACVSVTAAVQYLTHKNNPEKHQYDRSIIKTFGRADMSIYDTPTAEEIKEIRGEIYAYLAAHPDMVELCGPDGFIEYMLHNEWDWYNLYTSEGLVGIRIRELIASNRGIKDRKAKENESTMEAMHRAHDREQRQSDWKKLCDQNMKDKESGD